MSPDHPTRITVSGPGECINQEMFVIQKALETAGYVVTVKNDYPTGLSDHAMEQVVERSNGPRKVTLIADHEPWGG